MKRLTGMFLAFTLALTLAASAAPALAETAAAVPAAAELSGAELEAVLNGALAAEQGTLALYKAAVALDTAGRQAGRLVTAQERRITYLKGLLTENGFTVPADTESTTAVPATLDEILAAAKLAEEAKAELYKGYLAQNLPDAVVRAFNAFQRSAQMHANLFGRAARFSNGGMGRGMDNGMGRGMRGNGRGNNNNNNNQRNNGCNCGCGN